MRKVFTKEHPLFAKNAKIFVMTLVASDAIFSSMVINEVSLTGY
jgi:hypothetical protein